MGKAKLTHLDAAGKARMVDVGAKQETRREARAEGFILMAPATLSAIAEERIAKGEVLAVARVAGIMAAKKTGELIPLCHPLGIDSIEVDFDFPELAPKNPPARIHIKSTAAITAKTGVEMEALTAVTIAALTIYDMCKAIDRDMRIDGIRLVSKTGGSNDLRQGTTV